ANPASAPGAPMAAPAAGAAGGAAAGGGGMAAGAMVGLRLRYVRQEEIKNLDLVWKESGPVERQHTPNGTFGVLLSGKDRAAHMRSV
ncbi:MAG TPA: hypothetical protein DEV96_06410, partial [Rhodospirillum rubrum]|nr:hypothetical protein [Rhodospirillum rubrum]